MVINIKCMLTVHLNKVKSKNKMSTNYAKK